MLTQFKPVLIPTAKGNFILRPIEKKDNPTVAEIIRSVMTEFSCVGEGYSIEDPELDDMYTTYNEPQSVFFVLEQENGSLLGTAGVAPLSNGRSGVCELRKMYFRTDIRGLGLGRQTLHYCLEAARVLGFDYCYLETVARMNAAGRLYKAAGFEELEGPMGDTGHSGCDNFYGMIL